MEGDVDPRVVWVSMDTRTLSTRTENSEKARTKSVCNFSKNFRSNRRVGGAATRVQLPNNGPTLHGHELVQEAEV